MKDAGADEAGGNRDPIEQGSIPHRKALPGQTVPKN